MTTVVANLGVGLVPLALLYAPAVLMASFRRISLTLVNAIGVGTLLVVTLVGYVIADTGHGLRTPFRVAALILFLALVVGAVRLTVELVRTRSPAPVGNLGWVATCTVIAAIALVPELLALHSLGVTFGILSNGGPDIISYADGATHLLDRGFGAYGNIIGQALGESIKHDHGGAYMLSAFAPAATATTAFSSAIPVIFVATAMTDVAIALLVKEIWPTVPRVVVVATVVAASMGGLGTYTVSQDFLGGFIGSTCIITILAGALAWADRRSGAALFGVMAASGLGLYTYPPLIVPAMVAAPLVAAVVAMVHAGGWRPRVALRSFAAVALALVAAVIVAGPALSNAVRWLKNTDAGLFGWPLHRMTAWEALFWPKSLRLPATPGYTAGPAVLIGSWLVTIGAAALVLVVAARRRDQRPSIVVAALLLAGSCAVVALITLRYGAENYQSWKMAASLLPIAVASTLPAFGLSRSRLKPLLLAVPVIVALAAAAGPWTLWQGQRGPGLAERSTSQAFEQSLNDPQVQRLASLNVDLGSIIPQVAVASFLPHTRLGFRSLWAAVTKPTYLDAGTCTLTTESSLPPGNPRYVHLAGPYVLLMNPSRCRTDGAPEPAPTQPQYFVSGSGVVLSEAGSQDTYLSLQEIRWVTSGRGHLFFLNGRNRPAVVRLASVFMLPCAGDHAALTLSTPSGPRTVHTDQDPAKATLDLSIEVPAHGKVGVPFTIKGDRCEVPPDRHAYLGGFAGSVVH